VSDDRKFRHRAIEAMLAKKGLSPKAQRQGFARASAAKRFILTLIAPELLELRARHDALEMFVIDHCMVIAGTNLPDSYPDGVLSEAKSERLEQLHKKSLADLSDDDKLKHLADLSVNGAIWRDIEKRMIKDIENKQRKPLLDATGIEDT
jgi:hypothetical protein